MYERLNIIVTHCPYQPATPREVEKGAGSDDLSSPIATHVEELRVARNEVIGLR